MENKNYDPSLDDQIKFIEEMFNLSRGERDKSDWRKISGLKDPAIYPYNKSEKIYLSIKENLLIIKSFRESSIHQQLIPPCTPPSPEMQMKDALDRGELPDYITSTELVDVEKVIMDLLELVGCFVQTGSFNKADKEAACENAEAALGMLQAFKKQWKPSGDVGSRFDPDAIREFNKRGHIGSELQPTGESFKMPIKHGRLQKILTKEQREYLVAEISANLPFYKDINVQFAEAIIFAVDEIDKLKNV